MALDGGEELKIKKLQFFFFGGEGVDSVKVTSRMQ